MLEIFYDGSCNFCVRQVNKLRVLNKDKVLRFIDINKNPSALALVNIDMDEAFKEPHGVNDDVVFSGFELLLEVLRVLRYHKTVFICSLPGIKQLCRICFNLVSRMRKML